jgi:hypothetical protein
LVQDIIRGVGGLFVAGPFRPLVRVPSVLDGFLLALKGVSELEVVKSAEVLLTFAGEDRLMRRCSWLSSKQMNLVKLWVHLVPLIHVNIASRDCGSPVQAVCAFGQAQKSGRGGYAAFQ